MFRTGQRPLEILKTAFLACYSTIARHPEKPTLIIIGGRGAIGTPASYLATRKQFRVIVVDDGVAAFDNSTHTVHTSIVRPNRAIWPFMQAMKSWHQGGPLDIRLSPAIFPFGWQSFLQSYLVSENAVRRMWEACRALAFESRRMYAEIEAELGLIKLGASGRAHLSSPMISSDRGVVLTLKDKLEAVGVQSEVVEESNQIQSYVGDLTVRFPEIMVKYPEDFVLDLHKYKSQIWKKVSENDGICVHERAVGFDVGTNGHINAVLTNKGTRIEGDFVLCTAGWRAKELLSKTIGLDLNGDLTVAAGVRFKLPKKMVNRSVVCGPMFLAPGRDSNGVECTDVGQMFLINFEDTATSQKHLSQAVERFHTYFDYKGDIGKVWNCVGRPITPSGMPFIERVCPNMVVALGAGMFGASIGPGLAKRSLELLCEGREHSHHSVFQRRNTWDIAHSYLETHLKNTGDEPLSVQSHAGENTTPRIIQIGRRGSMTKAIANNLSSSFHLTVCGASDVEGILTELKNNPQSVVLVASHGSGAKLPPHYDGGYIRAEEILQQILLEEKVPMGIVVISGGIDPRRLQYLVTKAKQRSVRFVVLPSLATSMEMLVNACRGLLKKTINPRAIFVEDTFHEGKKEVPSSGSLQILKEFGDAIGWSRILIVTTDELVTTELARKYPHSKVILEKDHNQLEKYYNEVSDFVPIIVKSQRLPVEYVYAHRVSFQGDDLQITLEQRVTERDELIPPLKAVLSTLSSLPHDFTGTGISSVIAFPDYNIGDVSLRQMAAFIIESLAKSNSITRVYIPMENGFDGILTPTFFKIVPEDSVHRVPSPSLEIHSLVNGQPFQINIQLVRSDLAFP